MDWLDGYELTARTYGALVREGVTSPYDVRSRSEQEWLLVPNFGRKGTSELRRVFGPLHRDPPHHEQWWDFD